MNKYRQSFFITALLFVQLSGYASALDFQIHGEAAILMNAETGVVLFDYHGNKPLHPASTTKIATALYTLKIGGNDLQKNYTIPSECLVTLSAEIKRKRNYQASACYLQEPDGSHIGIKSDEILALKDLLNGMLISSGNDAANAIAHAMGPTVPIFVANMNNYLKEIGCKETFFLNPHGLHVPEHMTTAQDLAIITREALKEPVFCEIVKQQKFYRPKTNKQPASVLLQTNRLIRPGKFYYSKAIGVKTGYHSKSKHTFVAAAKSQDRILIAVLMGYPDRNKMFEQTIEMFETAFNQPKIRRIYVASGEKIFAKTVDRANKPLLASINEPLTLEYYPAEEPKVKCLLHWKVSDLPITINQEVGQLHLVDSRGHVLAKQALLSKEYVGWAWPYSVYKQPFNKTSLATLGLLFGLFICLIAVFKRR